MERLKTRHYPKIPEIVPRFKSDTVQEYHTNRTNALRFLSSYFPPFPENPELISSAHGGINELLLTIPYYAVVDPSPQQENPYAKVYKDLLGKLPDGIKTIILTHEMTKNQISQWVDSLGLTQNTKVIAAPDHLHFSIWAEDGYVITKDTNSNKRYFVEPYQFPRYADALIADMVSNQSELLNTQVPLYFQGGNVLIGDDFYMIGADYPAKSLDYIGNVIISSASEQPEETIKKLYNQYLDSSRKLIYVGSTIPVPAYTTQSITINGQQWEEHLFYGNKQGTVQPIFHIDMFITLAGRNSSGKYQVLVGDPKKAALTLNEPVLSHSMSNVFDNIAQLLQQVGFEVIRNPLPLVYVDEPEYKARIWYFASANNALVHITNDEKVVWLPTYGHGNWRILERTDQENKEIWESLGFTVYMLKDFHPFAENLGAVHCITKYLDRDHLEA